MLERELARDEEQQEDFREILEEEKIRTEEENKEHEADRRLGGRPGRYMGSLRTFTMEDHHIEPQEVSSDKNEETGWPALRPAQETGLDSEHDAQLTDPDERPNFLAPGNFEILLDTMYDQIGRWADREEIMEQMERRGHPCADTILAMEWLVQHGNVKTIDDGRKISKPEAGVRINGRRNANPERYYSHTSLSGSMTAKASRNGLTCTAITQLLESKDARKQTGNISMFYVSSGATKNTNG
jgi:hypothetical protein